MYYSAISQEVFTKYPPTDELQVRGVIQMVVQGMRQQKSELIAEQFFNDQGPDNNNVFFDSNIKNDVDFFFSKSNNRKNNKKWIDLSPISTLPANWDFETTNLKIIINDTSAVATFDFYWLMDVPVVDDQSIDEFVNPSKRKQETWHLIKTGGRWQVKETSSLLNVLRKLKQSN